MVSAPDRFSRRRFLWSMAAAGAAFAAPAMAGCASGGSSSKGTAAANAIAYWDYWVSQSPWVENELKLFAAANPQVAVKRTINQSGAYDKLFNLAERSNNAPDVFLITTTAVPLNQQAADGWLLPLDKYADSSWVHQFPPYSFAEGSNMFGGKIYSAPFTKPNVSRQLFINNKVFRDAGLTNSDGSIKIPKTWDDVTHAAETITKKGNGSVYGLGFGNSAYDILDWWTQVFVPAAGSPGSQSGQAGMDYRTGRYSYGSDRNYTDVLQLFLEWKNKGYFFPNSLSISDEIARAYFERGRFGMTVGGVWNQPEWTDHKFTDYTVTTLIGPQEQPKGYYYSAPGGTSWSINAKSKHPEQAWKWFSWLYSPDAGGRWSQQYNEDLSIFPQNNDATKIKFKPFADYVALQNLILPGPQPWVRNPEVGRVVINPVQPNFGNITTGLYSGQLKDIGAALTDLDTRSQQALETGVKQAQDKGVKVSLDDWKFPDWDITKPYQWNIPQYPA